MQVRAKRDHYHDATLRLKGEVFEHTGKLHEHIEPVDQPKPARAAAPASGRPSPPAPSVEDEDDEAGKGPAK